MQRAYPAFVWKDETSSYGVTFPDFDGYTSGAETLGEVYYSAIEALSVHIEGMKEDNEHIPNPTSYNIALKNGLMDNAFQVWLIPHVEGFTV